MVIKRSPGPLDETKKTRDETYFRSPGLGPRQGPVIPVYVDIPIVTPGGGRADVVRSGAGAIDVYNRGNNPYQVRPSDYLRMREINRREKQAEAQKAAARQRMVLLTAAPRGRNVSNILSGQISCQY